MAEIFDNIVSERFSELYKQLRTEGKVKNKSDIAEKLGTYNHVIGSIMEGKRNLTLDQINKLIELFGVNANYLFGRSSSMFGKTQENNDEVQTFALAEKIFEGRNNITLVPEKAAAGYAMAVSSPNPTVYLNQFQRFSVPGVEGKLIAFEISGDSMLPNITDGDLVICEPLERGEPIKDGTVYVVVTDSVVAKRIIQVRKNNELTDLKLISDNPMYPPFEVEAQEVRQILRVKCRLTKHGLA